MRKEINPVVFYVLSSLYIINFIQCVYYLISKNIDTIPLLTSWTFYMNSVYLLLNVISDSYFFFTKKENLEFLNTFSRNKMAQIVNSFSYMVFFTYWIAVLMGPKVMEFPLEFNKVVSSLWHHGLITILIILDLFLYEHKQINFNLFDVMLISFIFLCYGITLAVEHFAFSITPYAFMKTLSPIFLLLIAILAFGLMMGGYFIHILLLKLKCNNKQINNVALVGEKEGLTQD